MLGVRLVEYSDDTVSRGSILRLPACWPYEDLVEFMVVDFPDGNYGHSIVVSSGNKSGLVVVQLPLESRSVEHGISVSWLIKNWGEWVYPDCPVEAVYLFERVDISGDVMVR
ncbi:Imm45 family immunity protein [Pseudomonas asplenii]|uniref:Imm45 family immunity protein n=1 Tax=Pseudomonas asplenii TaxID=53407 RepID=UPI0009B61BDF